MFNQKLFYFNREQLTAIELDFGEFCAGAVNIHQLEAIDQWEQQAHYAYEIFENEGNRPIVIEELASVSW